MTAYANPRVDIPRSAGTYRPVGRLQPGWWVHLEPHHDAPEGTRGEWGQVKLLMDWADRTRTIVFAQDATDGDGNAIRAHKADDAVTLTEREATKLGLVAEVKA